MSTNPLSEEGRQAANRNSTNGAEVGAVKEDQNPGTAALCAQPEPSSVGRSTGPRTEQGKRISSKNALQHGFYSRELVRLHLRKEDRKSYLKLFDGILRDWNPVGQSELIQVELMTNYLYQLLQLRRLLSTMRGASLDEILGRIWKRSPWMAE